MAEARATRTPSRRAARRPLTRDEALVALFIGTMNANDHVSAAEGARAHHLIWSTHQFRRRSGDVVGRLIDRMRTRLEEEGAEAVVHEAARAIPAALRPSAFALVTDLLLADGTIDRKERRFLDRVGADLRLKPEAIARIIDVVRIKNRL